MDMIDMIIKVKNTTNLRNLHINKKDYDFVLIAFQSKKLFFI